MPIQKKLNENPESLAESAVLLFDFELMPVFTLSDVNIFDNLLHFVILLFFSMVLKLEESTNSFQIDFFFFFSAAVNSLYKPMRRS